MKNIGILDSAVRNLLSLPERVRECLWILFFFFLGAVAWYLVREVRRGRVKAGVRPGLAYIFRKDLYAHPTTRAAVINFALTNLLWFPAMRTLLAAVAPLISSVVVYGWLAEAFGVRTASIASPAWTIAFQVAVIFLWSEFGAYGAHWMLHRIPVLWAIHRVHHSAEALTVFTRLRDHPLDFIWMAFGRVVAGGIGAGAMLYAMGSVPSREAMMLFLAAGVFIPFGFDLWRHCHMPISLGRLNYVFNAPVMHQIHHSAEPRHFDRNLGAELMIFDWLFGTIYVPKGEEDYRWGLNEREMGANNPHLTMRGFYLEPFSYAARVLRGKAKAPARVNHCDRIEGEMS